MGIVFEEQRGQGVGSGCRVVVSSLIPDTKAHRAARVAQLSQSRPSKALGQQPLLHDAVRPGDVLRATTSVCVAVDFFGIRQPQRIWYLYKTDGCRWEETMRALQASFVADGDLTLVLERRQA
eukprot:SM009607S24928  [mRNA]  locus=s9607:1:523:- [translate_table: standard]